MLAGFSATRKISGLLCRQVSKRFKFKLPKIKAKKAKIELKMELNENFNLKISHNKKSIDAMLKCDKNITNVSFEIDIKNNDNIILGEIDKDAYLFEYPHVHLFDINIEIDGEIELTDVERKGRIMQDAVKIINGYRSYQEIHKIGSVYPELKPDQYPYSSDMKVFFGDLHVHTNYSMCGSPLNGSIEENVEWAKSNGLDFIAVTDHSEHMSRDVFQRYLEEIDEIQDKYNFIIMPAIEWTSYTHGHRNIYFKDTNIPFFNSLTYETNNVCKLYEFFAKHSVEAVCGAHHTSTIHHLANFDNIDERLERFIEIYSGWGNSEGYANVPLIEIDQRLPVSTVNLALQKGLKFAFVGGGDCHNTKPASGGLTAIITKQLSRESIFNALYNRTCYTTARDKILIDFHINGFIMGSIIKINQYSIDNFFPIRICASAICPNPIDKLEILCNGDVIYTKSHRESDYEIDVSIEYGKYQSPCRFEKGGSNHQVSASRYYYVRITEKNGNVAWSSPIWIDFEYNCD